MKQKKENPLKKFFKKSKRSIFLLLTLLILTGGLYAQIEFPAGDFWSLDGGVGMSDILVNGVSFQGIIEPKLWLSPPIMVGAKVGVNYSAEGDDSTDGLGDILTFEGQAYLRWNFLRLGKNINRKVNIFIQGGLGLLASYRGEDNPFDDVTKTRGSLLADGAFGVTIPLTDRWHLEPLIRGGYPHILGASITAGYKFHLPEKTKYVEGKTQLAVVELLRVMPAEEILKRMHIAAVEFILFGGDIGRYNIGIDQDAQGLNELVLNYTAQQLNDNPNFRVRIEGHANPVTTDPNEADELMVLSAMRANNVAAELRARGVREEQMVVISFGGTRTIIEITDLERWNRNRRVEIIIVQIDSE